MDCPALPTYDLAQARAFVEAGMPAASDTPFAWLSASERHVFEVAAERGCITLPERGYSLGAAAISSALPNNSTTAPVPDAGATQADSGGL